MMKNNGSVLKRIVWGMSLLFLCVFAYLSCRTAASLDVEGKPPITRIIKDKELDKRIDAYLQVHLAQLPTPLEKLDALTKAIGGPNIYIKRDDQTGLAFGGNKARKLEFIMADAVEKKCDVILTTGGIQSNWCRSTAAAARAWGIHPILILLKTHDAPRGIDGNLLLDYIFDADVRIIEVPEDGAVDRKEIIESIAEEQEKLGHKPYVVPVGGSAPEGSMEVPLGALSYTKAFLEIYRDVKKRKIKADYVVFATGSGGTQAGLVVGAKALGSPIKVLGISLSRESASVRENVADIATDTARMLNLNMTFLPEEILVSDDYVMEGYGILTQEIADAMKLVARTEGVLLDPVYTGKAMAGLIDLAKKGYFKKDDGVIFIHTGGTPAIFAYKEQLLELMKD
jgi:L-cysteate sulfo-lyase